MSSTRQSKRPRGTSPDPVTMSTPTSRAAADLQDERLLREEGIRGAVTSFTRRVRAGDLGSLPVVVGLVVIWVAFGILTPGGSFLYATNLVDLAVQCAAAGTISIGIVLVLLLGEIDLSVGSVSGLAAAILGVGLTQLHWPLIAVIAVALGVGALIGLLYGLLYTRFGVPSFVITLAGLLAFLGVQLLVLGQNGSINLPTESFIVQFALFSYLPPWLVYTLAVLAAGGTLFADLRRDARRSRAGLSTGAKSLVITKAVLLLVGLSAIGWYLSTDRGTGTSFVFFVLLVVIMNYLVKRTKWGRSIYAVGGNVEAARRSGIKVRLVYISVFMLCSVFAVIGGLLASAHLSAATLSSGGGDVNLNAIAAAVIGGTSLFGGRGNIWSALLGVIVIQSIANGLNLLNFEDYTRYIVTGAVLLLAVIIDSLSRRSRASHGAA
ncbi:simple sugar transport system permease protein/D-xylose transport system permease protein [Curtobacterium sp. PhB136]|nr:simple sugar transport system permease protein/D-xylose transport system permease protein [Curtobacterium sp. PhB136]